MYCVVRLLFEKFVMNMMGYTGFTYIYIIISSSQIIETSHDLTPKGSWGREITLFQGNLGWWNIIIWPDIYIYLHMYLPVYVLILGFNPRKITPHRGGLLYFPHAAWVEWGESPIRGRVECGVKCGCINRAFRVEIPRCYTPVNVGPSLKLTANAPEKWWLVQMYFLLKVRPFSGGVCC